MNKTFILSSGVQTGKTTALQKFVTQKPWACGILTPDVNGKRKLLDIATNNYIDFQLDQKQTENDIEIGKYIFSAQTFLQAQQIIQSSLHSKNEYLIIDEIGKLELQNKGLEPILTQVLNTPTQQVFILVIRDSLLEECIEKYALQKAVVFNLPSFISHFQLI